jgi:hypothetical protein
MPDPEEVVLFSRTAVIASLCALMLVACGSDDGETEGAPEPSAAPEENRVQVGMSEYEFELPDSITGGSVTLEFSNNGGLPHEAAFGSIEGDHDLDDVLKAIESRQEPPWAQDLAGIPVLDAGATASMVRDLDPGRYFFLCFLPVPGTEEVHASKGMAHLFEVEGTSGAEVPEADLAITATDDGIEVPEVPAGAQVIELVNDGSKPHEFFIFSLEQGKTERDIEEWFNSGFEADKPAVFPGGLQSIEPGTSVLVEMTFEAGRTYSVQDFENELKTEFEVQ